MNIQPGTTGPSGGAGTLMDPPIQYIIDQYKTLTKNVNPGGKLANAIKSLLVDPGRPLLLSYELNKLDLDNIIALNNEAFKPAIVNLDTEIIEHRTRSSLLIDNKPVPIPLSWAPSEVELKLESLHSVKSDEDPDSIFIAGSSVELENYLDVYAQVDDFFNSTNPLNEPLEITCNWVYKNSVLPQMDAVPQFYELKTNEDASIGISVFNHKIYNGFYPFTIALSIIEDDDAEYEAVQEVVGEIGEFAKIVQRTSSTISIGLAAGGITGPAAVATAALSTAAECVVLAADVVNAIIGIVNYFDENDLIGTIHINGDGDYSCDTETESLDKYLSEMESEPEIIGSGSDYKLKYAIYYSSPISYQRNWEVVSDITTSQRFEHGGGAFGSGHDQSDVYQCYTIEEGMQAITGLIQKNPQDASVHWLEEPRLGIVNGRQYKCCKVHWGCSAWQNITFDITLEALKFKKAL